MQFFLSASAQGDWRTTWASHRDIHWLHWWALLRVLMLVSILVTCLRWYLHKWALLATGLGHDLASLGLTLFSKCVATIVAACCLFCLIHPLQVASPQCAVARGGRAAWVGSVLGWPSHSGWIAFGWPLAPWVPHGWHVVPRLLTTRARVGIGNCRGISCIVGYSRSAR